MKPGKLFVNIAKGVANPNQPSYLVFFVTDRCNSRCKSCFIWRRVTDKNAVTELPLSAIEKIAKSLGDLPQLLLSGGEPFLRKDLSLLVKKFYDVSKTRQVSIPTNAVLPELIMEEVQEILVSCAGIILNINIALDGIGKDHDEIRGVPGNFLKVQETYRLLEKLREAFPNLNISFLTTMMKDNIDKIAEIADYVSDNFNANFHGIGPLRGEPPDKDEKDISFAKVRAILDSVDRKVCENKRRFSLQSLALPIKRLSVKIAMENMEKKKRMFHCLAGRKIIIVTSDGRLMPCEPLWLDPEIRHGQDENVYCMARLEEFDFNIREAMNSPGAKKIQKNVSEGRCYCLYGCAIFNSIIYSPRMYPRLLKEVFCGHRNYCTMT